MLSSKNQTMERRQFIRKSILGSSLLLAVGLENTSSGITAKNLEFSLPKLPFGYDALEPHIDKATMEIHHAKHHEAYIKNLNKEVAANSALDIEL